MLTIDGRDFYEMLSIPGHEKAGRDQRFPLRTGKTTCDADGAKRIYWDSV
jgi:hypothetical protein